MFGLFGDLLSGCWLMTICVLWGVTCLIGVSICLNWFCG